MFGGNGVVGNWGNAYAIEAARTVSLGQDSKPIQRVPTSFPCRAAEESPGRDNSIPLAVDGVG